MANSKRKCRNKDCGKFFRPDPARDIYARQVWCDLECRTAIALQINAKNQANRLKAKERAEKKAKKDSDRQHRERKKDLKPISHWLKVTQIDFNRFIVLKDAKFPCISCGEWDVEEWHCGHYRSRGAASHLRFTEDNCAKQCSKCNTHLSGNQMEFRLGLSRRGMDEERIKALENDNKPRSWTREELEDIRKKYKSKCKELESIGG